MTIHAAGSPLLMSEIATELGLALPLSLLDSRVLALAAKGAAPNDFNTMYGKSNAPTVSVSPVSPTARRATNTTGAVGVSATATGAGGSGTGYGYNWTSTDANAGGFALTGGTTATATWTKTVAPGSVSTGGYLCTVTDSLGKTGTVALTVELDGF